ncbi:hypothetical protein HQ524_04325 [Candidatus Uhrbacteria bacterium]|nr:hypothetical protein [Candidatus Uhrbacteria bacterium]
MSEFMLGVLLGTVIGTFAIHRYRSSTFRLERRVKKHQLFTAECLMTRGQMERRELWKDRHVDPAMMDVALCRMKRDGMVEVHREVPEPGNDAPLELYTLTASGKTWAQNLLA